MMGIGGSFEFVAGFRKRAPLLVQKSGFEWLWRLCMEPRRLWKRYLVGNSIFLFVVFRQWWSQSVAGPPTIQPRVRQPTREKQTSKEGPLRGRLSGR